MMRSKARFSCLFVLVVAAVAGADEINWAPNFDIARQAAEANRRLILIHFWAPNCPPCRVVESQVFPTASVAQTINENFIPLKVNANEQRDLALQYGVDRWPTDVVVDADGKMVQKLVTPQQPQRYVYQLASIAMASSPRSSQQNTGNGAGSAGSPWQSGPHANGEFVGGPQSFQNDSMLGQDRYPFPGNQATESRVADPYTDASQAVRNQFADSRFAQDPSTANPLANQQRAAQGNQVAGAQGTAVSSGQSISNPYAQSSVAQSSVAQSPVAQSSVAQSSQAQTSLMQSAPAEQSLTRSTQPTYPTQPQQTVGVPPQSMDNRFAQQPVANNPMAAEQRWNAGRVTNQPGPGNAASPRIGRAATEPTPPLALDGRCPVTLAKRKVWEEGDARWGAIHRGRTYLFVGQQEQQVFLQNPDAYSPFLAGMDVVALAEDGRIVEGSRGFGVLYDPDGEGVGPSRVYLFETAETRDRFENAVNTGTPDIYLRPIMQAMQTDSLETLLR